MNFDSYDSFCPRLYVETFSNHLKNHHSFFLEQLNHFWTNIAQDRFIKTGTMLDYGSGPVISRYITASKYIKTIIAAEYLEGNRKAIEDWIAQDPNAYDWKPFVQHVVQNIEGITDEKEVDKRLFDIRNKIKAVIPCDSKASNRLQIPMDSQADFLQPPYDVVLSTLTLEVVVDSIEEYKDHVAYLAGLVRPGGYLVIQGAIGNSFYCVGEQRFKCFPLITKELAISSIKEAGLKDIVFKSCTLEPGRKLADSKSIFVLHAKA